MTIDRILENTSAKVRFTCANGISYEVKIEGNDTSGIQALVVNFEIIAFLAFLHDFGGAATGIFG